MIKLLIGGSPCTYWSIAQSKNREVQAEGIGWELFKNYLIAREKFQPDFFLYENNKSAAAAIKEQISRELGVELMYINSALVSAQNRQRFYAFNWTVEQPADRGILLRDILETGVVWREKGYTLKANYANAQPRNGVDGHYFPAPMAAEPLPELRPLSEREMDYMVRETRDGRNHFDYEYFHDATKDKSACLTANTARGVPYNVLAEPVRIGTVENGAKNPGHDSKQYRVYSPEGKAVTLCGEGGGLGAKTGLYACPVQSAAWRGRGDGSAIEVRDDEKANALTAAGHQSRLTVEEVALFQNGHGFNAGGIKYDKSTTLTANGDWPHNNFVIELADGRQQPVYEVINGLITIKGKSYPIKLPDGFYIIRKLTPVECERLQTLPDGYTAAVSNTQRYRGLGNGWTAEVIIHILSGALKDVPRDEEIVVLSMYDGIGTGRYCLDKMGFTNVTYYAYEIDKPAIQVAMSNYPDIIQLGDAFQLRDPGWGLMAPELYDF